MRDDMKNIDPDNIVGELIWERDAARAQLEAVKEELRTANSILASNESTIQHQRQRLEAANARLRFAAAVVDIVIGCADYGPELLAAQHYRQRFPREDA
jgi:chromosome segregation ATPase